MVGRRPIGAPSRLARNCIDQIGRRFERWRRRGARQKGRECDGLAEQGKLARAADARAMRNRVEPVTTRKLAADFGVEQRGGEDCRTAVCRKMRDAPPRARIERVGLAQQPCDHAFHRRARDGRREEGVGIDAGLAHPGERQIETAGARIFADVARDIGELHRNAEIAGARQRQPVTHAHHQRHHHADRARDAHCIGLQFLKTLVAAAFRIPGEAFEQRFRRRARNGVMAQDIRHGAIRRRIMRIAVAGPRKTRTQAQDGVERAAIAIDGVVGEATEGVESVSRPAYMRRQHQRRRVKGA